MNNKQQVNIPETAFESTFWGRSDIKLSDEQRNFVNNIYDRNKKIVFCNAKAGSGKTTVAVMSAIQMYELGMYDGIIYIFTPVGFQDSIGLLPGTIEEKTSPFAEPLIEALREAKYDITYINQFSENINKQQNQKNKAFVDCVPHTFMRGVNFENKIVIIDESQNFYFDELKKVITRVKDSCKLIIIGHDGQCDLVKHANRSGFIPYLEYFKDFQDEVAICKLTKNFRGWISTMADELKMDIK